MGAAAECHDQGWALRPASSSSSRSHRSWRMASGNALWSRGVGQLPASTFAPLSSGSQTARIWHQRPETAGSTMSDNDIDASELAKWDPAFTAQANKLVAPIINRWFRVEVRALESIPPTGGVLLVSNHSGGALTPDPLVFRPGLLRHIRVPPPALHPRPLWRVLHAVARIPGPDRSHPCQPGKRRQGIALRRGRFGVSRRGLRRVPADAEPERHRLQRPHRVRQGRRRNRL